MSHVALPEGHRFAFSRLIGVRSTITESSIIFIIIPNEMIGWSEKFLLEAPTFVVPSRRQGSPVPSFTTSAARFFFETNARAQRLECHSTRSLLARTPRCPTGGGGGGVEGEGEAWDSFERTSKNGIPLIRPANSD